MIYLDRSRIQDADDCRRLRYLRYHWGGTGLAPRAGSLPLLAGQVVHSAIAAVVIGTRLEEALLTALSAFEIAVREKGVGVDSDDLDRFLKEQSCLLEGLVRLWAKHRWPLVQAEYDVIAVEQEQPWELAPGMTMLSRFDLTLRRKRDQGLFLMEFKTTSSGGDAWSQQWEHHSQVLAYSLAAQQVYQEPCFGVLIEGLVKGRRVKEKSVTSPFEGMTIQQSPLCYVYQKDSDSGPLYTPKWTCNWTKVPVWETLGVQRLVETVLDEQDAREILLPGLPISPGTWELERWQRQTVAKERKLDEQLEELASADDPEFTLDCSFPMNHAHCRRYFGYPCIFEKLCYDQGVAADPLGSGDYERRVPHHPLEQTKATTGPDEDQTYNIL